jgi:hypothetical protein
MFTTIMYGFINEVTRQPSGAALPLRAKRRGKQERSATRSRQSSRPAANATQGQVNLPGKYRVFADSFKRAAGYN